VSQTKETLPLWLTTPAVHRRSRLERALHRIVRPRGARQQAFSFVHRARRVDRWFKVAIAGITVGTSAFLLAALPAGRYLAGWLGTRARWVALRTVGLEPDREEIDAQWTRKREFDMASARAKLAGTFAEYSPTEQRLLHFAGMDPEHVLLRWGNFDRTVMLPATVFEADDTGRSYRLRANVRSIWIRNFPTKGQVKAYFPIPDTPEAATIVGATAAEIVAGSAQTTNS